MDENLAALARCFRALGYENRLELLSMLTEARTLNDIDLSPANPGPDENADRTLTRQGIQYHLDQLLEQGLIHVGQHDAPGQRPRRVYEIDRGRLFLLTEQIQDLLVARQTTPSRAGNGGTRHATDGNREPDRAPTRPNTPYLAVVHGPARGRLITLADHIISEDRGWVIGRSDNAHIQLPIDPLVADEHAEILPTDEGFEVLDLRTSGRTEVNWDPVPLGGSHPLASGDVIGVGHSLLVFSHPGATPTVPEAASQAAPTTDKVAGEGIAQNPPAGR